MKNRMCKTNCYKKCCAFLAALLMLAVLALPGMAAAPLVRDEMGLFDADTYNELEQSAEAASSGHDCDVYFLVVNDIGDANQRDFAKNYYVNNGLGSGEGKSGILFLLAVGSRKYVTITYGGGVTAFTDYRIEQMEDDIVPKLSDGDWAGAARTYIEMADYTLDYYAEHGEPIDVDNGLLFVIGIPAAIAAGVCLVFYHQMKTAKEKTEADDYMPGLKLRVKRDVYTHTTQTRVYDPPKEESRAWRCENKQPDPGNKNYVNHFGQSNPETGSGERKIRSQTRLRKKTRSRERKIRAQTRSRKKNGFGEKKIYSQTCEA